MEKRTLEGNGYFYGLDGGDGGFTGVYLSPYSSSCIYTLNIYSLLRANHTSVKWQNMFKK